MRSSCYTTEVAKPADPPILHENQGFALAGTCSSRVTGSGGNYPDAGGKTHLGNVDLWRDSDGDQTRCFSQDMGIRPRPEPG